jgi:hypothetical protein
VNRALLKAVVVVAVLLCPVWALAQGMIIFDGCTVLNSGSPWQDYVMFVFSAQAGSGPVNDMHICVYDMDGNPLELAGISKPGSWNGHFDPGSNCADYWTLDLPIPAGGSYGPFDFIVPPGHCYILVEWEFTLDGVVVDSGVVTWVCGATATEPKTWSAVKGLYR